MKLFTIPKPIKKGFTKPNVNVILEPDNKKKRLKDNFNGMF